MNIHRIDYRLLRSFLVVARIENFVRAAEALNITQSALSQQMKELASHFNFALFERKGRRSVLSEFGRDLLTKLEPLMGQVDEALLQSMHDVVSTGHSGAWDVLKHTQHTLHSEFACTFFTHA